MRCKYLLWIICFFLVVLVVNASDWSYSPGNINVYAFEDQNLSFMPPWLKHTGVNVTFNETHLNLTIDDRTMSIGNWTADKPNYATHTNLQTNITSVALNFSSIGNWTADKPNYSTHINLQTNITSVALNFSSIGNWTADKGSYALHTNVKENMTEVANNLTGYVQSSWINWTETVGNLSSIGNWTADKPNYATHVNLQTNITSVALNFSTIGNWTKDKGGYAAHANLDTNVSLLATHINLDTNVTGLSSTYVHITGDTVTGPLVLEVNTTFEGDKDIHYGVVEINNNLTAEADINQGDVSNLLLFERLINGTHIVFDSPQGLLFYFKGGSVIVAGENATFEQDVTILGTLHGGSPVKIAGINITKNTFMLEEDRNSSSRFTLRNINSGSNASARISAINDVGGIMSIGIGSSNFMVGNKNYQNATALLSKSRGDTIFANLFKQPFIWLFNPSDDNDPDNLVEIMRLDENGLNVSGTIINTNFTALTDDSMADTLHRHSELSASDGSPDPALQVDAIGRVSMSYDLIVDSDLLFVDVSPGRVGIGTSSPASLLHVNDDVAVSNTLLTLESDINNANEYNEILFKVVGGANYGAIRSHLGSISDSYMTFSTTTDGGTLVQHMTIQHDGKIGFGTNNPGKKVEIYSSSPQLRIRDSGSTAGSSTAFIEFGGTDGGSWNRTGYIGDGSAGDLDLYLQAEQGDLHIGDSSGIVMNLQGGNVGIGTATPATLLDVQGGNANVSGNLTAENVFLPQYIFAHTNVTLPVRGANLWTNVTFDQEVTQIKQGIEHTATDGTNTTFTMNIDGIYYMSFNFDMIDTSVGASDIDIAGRLIFTNGTEIDGSVFETDLTKQQIETELSHEFLVELKKGDKVVFQFIADDADIELSTHSTFGDHPDSATAVIKKYANIPK